MQPRSRLRILKIRDRKRAFSLEPVFWEALEEIARAHKQRLATFLGALLGDGPHRNASSILRANAVDWLLTEYRKLCARDYAKVGQRIVEAMPIPAFVVNQNKQIVAFNRAFLQLGARDPNQRPPIAQLRLNAAFPRVVQVLTEAPDRPLTLNAILDFGHFEHAATVTIAFLETVGSRSFFLCTLRNIQPSVSASRPHSLRLNLSEPA
jgi:predicted DNA-binding ribbon-helix-helix protein